MGINESVQDCLEAFKVNTGYLYEILMNSHAILVKLEGVTPVADGNAYEGCEGLVPQLGNTASIQSDILSELSNIISRISEKL